MFFKKHFHSWGVPYFLRHTKILFFLHKWQATSAHLEESMTRNLHLNFATSRVCLQAKLCDFSGWSYVWGFLTLKPGYLKFLLLQVGRMLTKSDGLVRKIDAFGTFGTNPNRVNSSDVEAYCTTISCFSWKQGPHRTPECQQNTLSWMVLTPKDPKFTSTSTADFWASSLARTITCLCSMSMLSMSHLSVEHIERAAPGTSNETNSLNP